MTKQLHKILIRGVNWIGDAVLTIPAIKSVRQAFPDAHISVLVKPWVSEIFRENPDIDEIIHYDDRFRGLRGKFRLAKALRSKHFDAAILYGYFVWVGHGPGDGDAIEGVLKSAGVGDVVEVGITSRVGDLVDP